MLEPKPDGRLCADISFRADIARVCLLGILQKTAALPTRHPGALFFARSIVATLRRYSQASADRPGWFADIFPWHRAMPSRLAPIQTAFGTSPRFPLTLFRRVSFQSHPGPSLHGKECVLPHP